MKWMDAAWSEAGTNEVPGPASNPKILAMFAAIGYAPDKGDDDPWCAAYVGHCLMQAGLPSTMSARARSYLDYGTPIDGPRTGAICVLKRGTDPNAGHVAFVVGWTETLVHLLGGNQADGVRTQSFPRADVLGFRWPPEPAAQVAKASRKEAIADVQTKTLVVAGGTTAAVKVGVDQGWLEMVSPLIKLAQDSASLIIVGAVVIGLAASETLKILTRQDIAEGRYRPSGDQ